MRRGDAAAWVVCTLLACAVRTSNAQVGGGGLIISKYLEGRGFDKAIEIENRATSPVTLDDFSLEYYFDGSFLAGNTINLVGTLPPGDRYVVVNEEAEDALLQRGQLLSTSPWYNGNDVIRLTNHVTRMTVDSMGKIGEDPLMYYGTSYLNTQNVLLCRAPAAPPDVDITDEYTIEDLMRDWTPYDPNLFEAIGVAGCPTDVPPTPIPSTPAPATPAPPTPLPETNAPPTLSPSTPIPVTDTPQTSAPATLPPPSPTAVPNTDTPDTFAPTTQARSMVPSTTAVPSTKVPTTLMPSTIAPATAEPATPVVVLPMPMPAPATGAPGTLVPVPGTRPPVPAVSTSQPQPVATGVPETAAPAFATGTPATAVPGGGGSGSGSSGQRNPGTLGPEVPAVTFAPEFVEAEEEARASASAGSGAALVAAAVGGGAAPAALRLATAALACHPNGDRRDLRYALAMSPTQLRINGSLALGAVVGNAAVVLGMVALTAVIARCLCKRRGPGVDPWGAARFPSVPLATFAFLYQGTTLAALELVVEPTSSWMIIVGCFSTAIAIAIPAAVFHTVRRGVRRTAFVKYDPLMSEATRPCRWARMTFLGAGEWISHRPQVNNWAVRWGCAVRPYQQHMAWFGVLEFATTFAVSGVHAGQPQSMRDCGHIKVAAGAIFLIFFLVELACRPHMSRAVRVMAPLETALQSGAMFLYAGAYYSADEGSAYFGLAARVLTFGVSLIVLRCLVEFIAVAAAWVTGRRRRLQHLCEEEAAAAAMASPSADPLEMCTPPGAATAISREGSELTANLYEPPAKEKDPLAQRGGRPPPPHAGALRSRRSVSGNLHVTVPSAEVSFQRVTPSHANGIAAAASVLSTPARTPCAGVAPTPVVASCLSQASFSKDVGRTPTLGPDVMIPSVQSVRTASSPDEERELDIMDTSGTLPRVGENAASSSLLLGAGLRGCDRDRSSVTTLHHVGSGMRDRDGGSGAGSGWLLDRKGGKEKEASPSTPLLAPLLRQVSSLLVTPPGANQPPAGVSSANTSPILGTTRAGSIGAGGGGGLLRSADSNASLDTENGAAAPPLLLLRHRSGGPCAGAAAGGGRDADASSLRSRAQTCLHGHPGGGGGGGGATAPAQRSLLLPAATATAGGPRLRTPQRIVLRGDGARIRAAGGGTPNMTTLPASAGAKGLCGRVTPTRSPAGPSLLDPSPPRPRNATTFTSGAFGNGSTAALGAMNAPAVSLVPQRSSAFATSAL